jgi:hypothetical protein
MESSCFFSRVNRSFFINISLVSFVIRSILRGQKQATKSTKKTQRTRSLSNNDFKILQYSGTSY